MAKTHTQDAPASSQDDILKKRKKLAKKEAKLMLKVEQARKDVQKVEQKIHKAQDNLKTRTGRLHDLEGELSQLQQSIPEKPAKADKNNKASKNNKADKKNKADKLSIGEKSGQTTQAATNNFQVIDAGDSYQDSADVEAFHRTSLDPVEGGNGFSDENMNTDNQPEQSNDYLSEVHHTPEGSEEQHDGQTNKAESSTNLSAEDITIHSGEGDMPVETTNEHAWPPPLIREEVAEAIEEEAKNEPTVVEKHTHPAVEPSLNESDEEEASDHSDTSPRHSAIHGQDIHTSTSHQSEEEKDQDTQSGS